MTRSPIPVFVCDPQPATLRGIEQILSAEDTIAVIGSTLDANSRLQGPDPNGPLVYVVDQVPGDVYDTALLEALVAADPTRRVVVYSAYDRIAVIASVYAAGASAFISKLAPQEQLLDAICAVHGHEHPRDRYYPGRLAVELADFYSAGGRAAHSPRSVLTKRQLQIYLRIAEGFSAAQVAEELGMNRRTVGNQLVLIRRKLDIPREHFRSYAIEYGLIDPLRSARPAEPEDGAAPESAGPGG